MRYSELEAQTMQEAPMGFFSNLGNQIAARLGSASAQGRLEAGQVANYIYKQFLKNLGASNQKPTQEILAGFLKSTGIPGVSIQAAQQKSISEPQQPKTENTASPLTRKQIGQFILTAVQHANQSGTLSFDQAAQPASHSAPQTAQDSSQTLGPRTSQRMDTELRALHNQVLQGDVQAAQALVQSLSDINTMVKRHANAANKSIGRGVTDPEARKKLIQGVRILTRESYQHLTRVFEHANITWSQAGYQVVMSESTRHTVALKPINNKKTTR